MKRETSLFSALAFLLVTAPLMFTQGPQSQAGPVLPSDILGPQLIVWSQAQKPQPVPQPLPAERPVPDQQPEQPSPVQNPPARQQQPTAQKFTGTIVKDGGVFC